MKQRMRGGRGAVTIGDVARKAGVSPMTVSRVINGETNVRPTTRDKVNAAISALSYSPNPAARSLAGAQPVRIGLLYSNPSAAYLTEFLVGSLDYASRSSTQLIVEKCDPGEHEIEVARAMIVRGIDGIVLPPPLCDSGQLLVAIADEGVPLIAVGGGAELSNILNVSIDDYQAAHEMTRHIVSLGHRRVGFVIGNPGLVASGKRLEGYRAALADAGIAVEDALITQGLFTYRSGLDAAETLLDQNDPPTAIFASNDDMAAAAVAVAHRRGLDVPGDLTICGFDDTTLATAIWPELTTIRQPIAEMARTAVEVLVQQVKARRSGEPMSASHLELAYELVRRQSDAPPRRRPSVIAGRRLPG